MLWWQDGITWLLLPPDQSLAFLLVDNGFDVWLANTRGSKYSRGHTSLSPNEQVSSLFPTCYSLLPFYFHIHYIRIDMSFRLIGIGHGMNW